MAIVVALVAAVAIAVAACLSGFGDRNAQLGAEIGGRPMKAIDLVDRVFGACRSSRAPEYGTHAGPAAVALSLRLWQRADRPPRGPHALVRLPAR